MDETDLGDLGYLEGEGGIGIDEKGGHPPCQASAGRAGTKPARPMKKHTA